MVILSFHEQINQENFDLYSKLFDGRLNPNRCPVKASYFVSDKNNNYRLTKKLYDFHLRSEYTKKFIFMSSVKALADNYGGTYTSSDLTFGNKKEE